MESLWIIIVILHFLNYFLKSGLGETDFNNTILFKISKKLIMGIFNMATGKQLFNQDRTR